MKTKIEKRNYIQIKKLAALILLVISAAMFGSCKGALVDPPPSYFEIIEGPKDGDVLNTDRVYFKWRGSSSQFEYRFKLYVIDKLTQGRVEYLEFSEWNSETDKLFEKLDEGAYVFQIQASYEGSDPIQLERKFEIDAVQGPSIMFYKTETKGELGNYADVNIWVEDVDSLTALTFEVGFEKSMVQLDSIGPGDIFKEFNIQQFLVPKVSLVRDEINNRGTVEISTGVMLADGGSAKSVSGDGKLITLRFYVAKIGRSSLEFHSINARTLSGNIIALKPKDGIINGIN